MFSALPTLIPHLDDQRRVTLLRRADRYRTVRASGRRRRRRQ